MHRFLLFAVTLLAAAALPLTACDGGGESAGTADAADATEATTDTGSDDYAERMAAEHAGDEPTAGLAETEGDAAGVEVETEEVQYATVDGTPITGYLARPAGATPDSGLPGIVVIHEWWGLNGNVETMARMLAREGYAALAVDLYRGESAATPDEARSLVQAVDETRAEANLRQAHDYLAGEWGAPRVGVIGWCFGGGWSLRTALLLPEEIDATVIYYGRLVTERERLAKLQMPILGVFGAEDQGIPVEGVREFEAILEELGKTATIHVYEGAGHAFANPSGQRYEPEAAKDAWGKTVAFLAEHLKSS